MSLNFLLKTLQVFFVLYGSVVPGVFHWCYLGIPLVLWSVPLVFWVMFSCSATVPECSAVPSVFWVPFFRVPAFLVSRYADHYDVVKCRRNLNFEKMDTAPCTGKNDGFWLLWGICKEYIKQNIIKAVLRKANAHPSVICKLIKNQ